MITPIQVATARRVWMLCRSVAREIWLLKPPTPGYADAVAWMLYMLAAYESAGFLARRQWRFLRTSTGGAFSLWQIECAGIAAARVAVEQTSAMRERCLVWLYRWQGVWPGSTSDTLLAVQDRDGDALACLCARVYHLLDPAPVPEGLEGIAVYCKEHHNYGGKATSEKYLNALRVWAPVVDREWRVT